MNIEYGKLILSEPENIIRLAKFMGFNIEEDIIILCDKISFVTDKYGFTNMYKRLSEDTDEIEE